MSTHPPIAVAHPAIPLDRDRRFDVKGHATLDRMVRAWTQAEPGVVINGRKAHAVPGPRQVGYVWLRLCTCSLAAGLAVGLRSAERLGFNEDALDARVLGTHGLL
jgi:hypothetical protein